MKMFFVEHSDHAGEDYSDFISAETREQAIELFLANFGKNTAGATIWELPSAPSSPMIHKWDSYRTNPVADPFEIVHYEIEIGDGDTP